jgi:hypothetical protein
MALKGRQGWDLIEVGAIGAIVLSLVLTAYLFFLLYAELIHRPG